MKKRQVVLYIIVMLILITTSVYATISAELNFTITADGSKFYAGDKFSIAIGLKNIDSEKGIKSIEGYIDIDENVIENLTVESIVTDEDGKVHVDENNILPVYDASDIKSDIGIVLNTNPIKDKGDYKLVINLENPIKNDTDLVTFKFKIKDDVAPGTYSTVMAYNLFTIFEDDAGEKLELDRKSFKIDIADKNNVNNNTTNNTTNNTINNNIVNNIINNNVINNNTVNNITKNVVNNTTKPVNNATSKPTNNTTGKPTQSNDDKGGSGSGSVNKSAVQGETSKKDSTVAPTNLPKTGYRLLLVPIIAIVMVGLVFYKKYSKYNNYHE